MLPPARRLAGAQRKAGNSLRGRRVEEDTLHARVHKRATTKNAIRVLRKAEAGAGEANARILQLNTDRGSQFFANKRGRKGVKGVSEFERYLESRGIRHVPSRIPNPQTNGKVERWFQEYIRHRFGSAEEFARWYNNRLHGALELEWAETPSQAFVRKLRPESLLGLFFRNVMKEA